MKFKHRIAGAKFHMPDGKEISFAGGEFDTEMVKDSAVRGQVEHELLKIANVPSSMIYTTDKPMITGDEKQAVVELTQSASSAFDTINKTPPGTQTVPMPMGGAQVPNLHDAAAGVTTGGGDILQAKLAAAKHAVEGVSKGTISPIANNGAAVTSNARSS